MMFRYARCVWSPQQRKIDAGLIYFVEKYNVRLPDEFVRHAVDQDWRVSCPLAKGVRYVYSYFDERESDVSSASDSRR